MSQSKHEILDGQHTIAIIGVGAKLPGALSAPAFWDNVKNGVYAISDVPVDRWNPSLYWNPDPLVPDKTYSKIGGWVTGFEFDRKAFRLPPSVIEKIDPTQLLCLEAVREAFQDSGYDERDFDRDRCAVILGNALGGDLRDQTNLRIQYAELDAALRTSLLEVSMGRLSAEEVEQLLEKVAHRVKDGITGINEDSMPGELANIIAGRVAQSFDLRGPNFVCDAACASTLAALESAIFGLRAGQFDMVVTGGADRSMGAPSYVKFSKIGALSADGSRPFDADANGFVMGEGAGILVLKRLADAINDGDKIYALIRGVGGSSDGRGKGITAPNPRGQEHALRRAYADAGVTPRTVTLIEAHGTSTPVGDPAEVESLRVVFDEDSTPVAPGSIGLGSVKSMIGHLKSAAAAASLVKIAFALRDKVLPPTINVETPNPLLKLDGTPFRLQTELAQWDIAEGSPRRAGISAFGFGGTNFHAVLEEYDPDASSRRGITSQGAMFSTSNRTTVAQASATLPDAGVLGFAAGSLAQLAADFDAFASRFSADRLVAIEHLIGPDTQAPRGDVRVSISFATPDELIDRVERTSKAFEKGKGWKVLANSGIFLSEEKLEGKVAMLFPGQGTQYLGMLGELRSKFAAVRETLAEADAIMGPVLDEPLSGVIYPPESADPSAAFLKLCQTEITQPAVLTADIAILRTLQSLGVHPDMVAGHSLGEYGACVAAQVMTFEEALRTVARRGTEMAKATPMNGDAGLMVGLPLPVDEVEAILAQVDGYVVCANKNCSRQTIIAGLTEPVKAAIKLFEAAGHDAVILPVSHAFHSEVVAAASAPLRRHLDTVDIRPPSTPILTNVTGGFYPSGPGVEDEIRDLLALQVAAPVEFIELIERMYEAGARVFVEVGPKRAQTTFVSDILDGRPHVALFTNHPKRGDLGTLYDALAQLWSIGAWTTGAPRIENQQEPVIMTSTPNVSLSFDDALATMIRVLCEKTGYDADEIEPDFELEADLGIDTVKQAEIMASVRDIYGFAKDDEFRLAEYPTLNDLARYITERVALGQPAAANQTPAPTAEKAPAAATAASSPTTVAAAVSFEHALDTMIGVLCEKTGYDADEIEPDFELEADLGIDTVKQAEIMASVRDIYGFAKDDEFRLAEYPTLNDLARYITERVALDLPAALVAEQLIAHQTVAERPAASAAQPAVAAQPQAVNGSAAVSFEQALGTMVTVLCEKTGYDSDEIEPDFELEADLGIDTVKQAEIMASVRDIYGFAKDDEFRLAEYPTLNDLARYIVARVALTGGNLPVAAPVTAPATITLDAPASVAPRAAVEPSRPAPSSPIPTDDALRASSPHDVPADVVISGCALGLPGLDELFAEDAVDHLLAGENMIGEISATAREAMASKRIVRLVKHEDGSGEMVAVDDVADVLKLAGQRGRFDLGDWDIPERVAESIDATSQMAIAAGLIALRDAGLPLIPKYRTTTNGKKITIGWMLPPEIGDRTGVIFASAFGGQDYLAQEITRSMTDPEYKFDHRFLLKTLGIANSRFAEFVGARGPNTKINSACASTTTAMAMSQDWIRAGRCDRVVILGADDASGDSLIEWIGAGFLATGAATTEGEVENAALPFDRRRNGIIIGMGAVALVVERGGLPEARGIEPIADLLTTRFVNSAEHPTRLDVDHIADEVGALIADAEATYKVDRYEMASRTVFVSHETYSPARGGSAATEIESLRRTFGPSANEVVVANTKGFTGHAMAAGIEDVLALKALQRETLPHIANFKEPDPDLGDLRLSQGGAYELDYALRLAAGFGSQLALALLRFRARTEDRVFAPQRYEAWLTAVSGFENPQLATEHRTLRLREGAPKQLQPVPVVESKVVPAPVAAVATQPDGTAGLRARRRPTFAAASADQFQQLGVVVEAQAAATYEMPRLKAQLSGKRVAVVAGPMVVTELIVRALDKCGARVVVLEDTEHRNPLDADFVACDLTDEAALGREFAAAGPIDGVVNLLGFGAERFGSQEVYRAARHSFHVARAWRFSLGRTPAQGNFFLTVTGMGGRLGFDRASGPLPVCGAVAGFTKSLAREWEDATIRVIDVARRGIVPDLGLQVLHETLFGSGVEVGLIAGIRYTPATVPAADITPEALPSLAPSKDDVLVITGGAKGITAEVAMDLAQRYGCKLALVGRTPLRHADPLGADMDAEKARARAQIEAAGERATPVKIRDLLWTLESERVIAANVLRMREAGSDVEYFACDVADEASVREMIAAVVGRFGSVDGIIHGAGVEESRLIEDKDVAGFDRVFRGKALGALHLWAAAEQYHPKFYMAFSSVAGRFGNPGQVDYAAANEVLNKLVALLNHDDKTRATSIDWTAWDEVGMAAEGSMKTLLESRGVQLLPPSVGAPMVGDFLDAGMSGEFVVAGALGDFARETAPAPSASTSRAGLLVSDILEQNETRVVVARTFDLAQDRFLRDHVYEGNPIVPGVMGFEMMVEAASLLGGPEMTAVTDVRFEHAIKLHRDEPVRLIATAEKNEDRIDVVVRTIRTAKTGREIETVHYRSTVRTQSTTAFQTFTLDPSADLLEGPERDAIYEKYFHTGLFRVLDSVPWIGPDFVIGYGRLPRGPLVSGRTNDEFGTDPMVREMAFQTAGLWGMVNRETSYLPYAIDHAEQFGCALPEEQVVLRCRTRDDADEHMIAFDIEALGADGRLLQRMHRVQLVGHRTLASDEKFAAMAEHRMRTVALHTDAAKAQLAARGLTIDTFVDAEERVAYDRLISERRKGEWLAARVAVKTAVADFVRDFVGVSIPAQNVRIRKDDKKAPSIVIEGYEGPLPAISISHSGGVSVAGLAASRTRAAIGVDLEAVEQRDESFARNYFSDAELALDASCDHATLLAVLWSVKEAVSKAVGTGLHARLEEFEVRSLTAVSDQNFFADVAVKGLARDAYQERGGLGLDVRVEVRETTVLATAVLTRDPASVRGTLAETVELEATSRPATTEEANDARANLELVAIAALLKHRGLVPTSSTKSRIHRTDLGSWKG